MKNDLAWAKTVLSVYRYLERICGAIDKIVLQSGLGSSNITGNNYFYNNVHTITERIIDLSERKVTLINLKVVTEDVLTDIDQEDAQILIEKYVDFRKCREIAERHDISIRTVFRKLGDAETSFSKNLCRKGFNSQKLDSFLQNEPWIKNVYESFRCDENEDVMFSNKYLEKVAAL